MNQTRLRQLAFATAISLCFVQPQIAFGQALPWQNGSQSPSTSSTGGQSSSTASQPTRHHHHKAAASQPSAKHHGGSRAADDRKLDALATRFYSIHEHDQDAISKLGKLDKEVTSYHASLKHRDYDVSDISKDVQKLHQRIAAQHKEWQERAAAAPAPAAAVTPMPAPMTVPPAPAPAAAPPAAQATTLSTAPAAGGIRH